MMRARLEEALVWGAVALAVAVAAALGVAGPAGEDDDPARSPPCEDCRSCAKWRDVRGTRPSPGS
jgi:hypothetical protein